MPARQIASSSSVKYSKSSKLEEKDEDVEHDDEETHEQPYSPKSVDPMNTPTLEVSKPSTSAEKADYIFFKLLYIF